MIEKCLTISTAHTPKDAGEDHDFGPFRVSGHEFGWIIFIFKGAKNVPKWLLPIYKYAYNAGCVMIMFDQDADSVDEFECYDW